MSNEIREHGATLALHASRTIEELMNYMNDYEGHFVVADSMAVFFEWELHEHIAKYMRLYEALMLPKPEEEEEG